MGGTGIQQTRSIQENRNLSKEDDLRLGLISVFTKQDTTLSLLHIQLSEAEVEDGQDDVSQDQQTEQDGALQHHVLSLGEEGTQSELSAPTQRLPHLVVGHGSVTLAVQTIEGLENGRRLRLPDGITGRKENDHEDGQAEISSAVGIIRDLVEDEEDEGDDLEDEGPHAHHTTRHPLLLHQLTEGVGSYEIRNYLKEVEMN